MHNLVTRLAKLAFIASLLSLCSLLTGCGINPSYTVRVDNQSSKSVLARLERRPSMNNMIVMESVRVKGDSEAVLGPHEARPLERVYIVIQGTSNVHDLPESHKLMRGSYVVTVTSGSAESWDPYEVSVKRE